MKLIQKILFLLLIIFILIPNYIIKADEDEYLIYDAKNNDKKESFVSYNEALRYFNNNLDEYDNAILKENDNVIKMEYGIVEFKTNEGCQLNIDYYSEYLDNKSSFNACYGVDGAYVSSDKNNVYFIISGDYGYTSLENVILHPFEELNVSTSIYEINNKNISHNIKTQLLDDYFSYSIPLGEAPSYLKDGQYYSYDGHYFYNNFYDMIDDYIGNDFEKAINPENPYYNYYQYLSYRTISNYEYEEIEKYFYESLGFDSKLDSYEDLSRDNANDIVNRSQYYGELKSFFEYQCLYGANALMMLSQSINETSYGKSLSSYVRNSLFINSAYESDEERNTSRYNYLESSIYSYAKYYISQSYSNYRKATYYGAFFGNKAGGINVDNSLDPYWGEKAASNYYRLDKELNEKDKNAFCLGIINKRDNLNIYRDQELRSRYYTINNIKDFSFVILNENEDSYEVQLDPSFNSDYLYDFDHSIGYIRKNDIDYLINENKINKNEFVDIEIDGNGGKIAGFDNIILKVKKGSMPVINSIRKDGFEFIGFDKEIVKADKEETYVSEFKKIDRLELANPFKTNVIYGEPLDLSDGKLKIIYDDKTEKIIEIESDMISNFYRDLEGTEEIYINYCGLQIPIKINNSIELLETKNKTLELINKNITSYENNKTYNNDDLKYIKQNINNINYNPTFKEIRLLDEILLEDFDKKIFINDDKYNLSISGLALNALNDDNSLFSFLNNTYYINVNDIEEERYKRLESIASAYNFNIIDGLNISLSLNYHESDILGPVIIQLNIPDMDSNKVYSIYHLKENGDVIKCRTTQTNNYVQFMTEELGDFMILSLDSANTYTFDDMVENISMDNDYYDNHGFVRNVLVFSLISIIGFIMIVLYFILINKKENIWRDYKKSLQAEDIVQEEKLKN